MKNNPYKRTKRIALISVAAAVIAACCPLPAFAAAESQPAKVIYTGNGTTQTVEVQDAANLNTFYNLMPGGSTERQNIQIQNKSGKPMRVYFMAVPKNAEDDAALTESSQKLLSTLNLTVTFKMDDVSPETTLYAGKASGTGGAADPANARQVTDITAKKIPLGYVYGNSTSGLLSAVLSAPETMGNEFQSAKAAVKWVFQFELANPPAPSSHSGGGGKGGGTGVNGASSVIPTESLASESVPQGGPTSSASPGAPTESIPEEDVPLSKPPKTGEAPGALWIVLVVALAACVVFVVARERAHSARNDR